MKKKSDRRPICYCDAYDFPHKIGGKCRGLMFINFHFGCVRTSCAECNCLNDVGTVTTCDVATDIESIREAECYRERLHYHPGERLPLQFEFVNEDQEHD